jgi:hypothetical protein
LENHSIPIIRLSDYLRISNINIYDEMYLLLPKKAKRNCGILISKIVDIGNYQIDLDTENINQEGITGNTLINNKLTLMLDSEIMLNMALNNLN